ncbi:MAG: cytochrome P450 [Myxococcota bacterium]
MSGESAVQNAAATAGRPIPRMEHGHWLWGNLKQLAANRSGFLIDGHAKYGDVFSARVLGRELLFVRDPAVVNAINVTHWEDFYKPAHIKVMWKPFLGEGLVPNDGDSWKRQHKLIRPGFHKRRVDAYAERMVRFTRRMVDRWVPGEQRDFREEIVALALVVVCDTLFDIDIEQGDAESIRNAMIDISEILVRDADKMIPRPSWWPTEDNRRRQRAIKAVEEIISRAVEERRSNGQDRGDLFSHMVFVEDDHGKMTDKQLRDEAMTLIFAGHETTAHALSWAWYLLASNPDKAATMREEIDRVVGDRRIDVDDLPKLPYLEMVIKESLRLLPSVWAYAREPQRDMVLEGYFIKKGTPVTVSHIAMGRNPRYFEEPMEFRPERWTREFEKSLPKGAYTPFAQGPRVCLGKQFAMMEMRIVLGTLMQCVEPNLIDGFEPDIVTELSMHPGERGLPMTFRPRG